MTDLEARVRHLIRASGLRISDQLETMIAPSIRLKAYPANEDDLPVGTSKIGGSPDLPPGVPWPEANGSSLPFVAQINLADVAQYDIEAELPRSGLLSFFFDQDGYFSAGSPERNSCSRVIYSDVAADRLERRAPPGAVASDWRVTPLGISFSREITMPGFETPHIERLGYSYDSIYGPSAEGTRAAEGERVLQLLLEIDQLLAREFQRRGPVHRMLGHPDAIQAGVEYNWQADYARVVSSVGAPTNARDWRLLLQVDSEDEPMVWGDVGRIYFGIPREALARRDFTRTCLVLQCT